MNDYERIAGVLRYIDQHSATQPDLATLAEVAELSEFHFHRLFSRFAGVTPKAFLQCLTLQHAKSLLSRGESVLDASLDVGLSGPGRLHDLCVKLEAASPGEVKSGGAGWTITAGFSDTPFGTCLVGQSPRGVCHVSFESSTDQESGESMIRETWPAARIVWDNSTADAVVESSFARQDHATSSTPLRAVVRGSEFQVRVWRALLRVPLGEVVSYGQLAQRIDKPGAARAVGSAVGRNALAYLIPCHRVIRETGAIGEYRWGSERKQIMLAWEEVAELAMEQRRNDPEEQAPISSHL